MKAVKIVRYISSNRIRINVALPTLLLGLAMVAAACGAGDNSDETTGADSGGEGDGTFYEDGDEIELIVPFAPGGGTDVFAYFIAEKLNEAIEADVDIYVTNVSEGPGIGGVNQYEQNREHDGYSLAVTSNSSHIPFMLGNPAVAYELGTGLVPIAGAFPNDRIWYARADTGIESVDDLKDGGPGVVVPTITMTGGDIPYVLALEFLGLDHEVVDGHDGGAGRQQAFQQGEATLNHDTPPAWDAAEVMVENGEAHRVFARGNVDSNGEWVDSGFYPDLPIEVELYREWHGEEPSGELYEVYKGAVEMTSYSNIMWIHDDAPQEAREELEAAIAEFEGEAGFYDEAADVLGEGGVLDYGESFRESISERFDISDDLSNWIWEWLGERFGIEDGRN